MSSEHWASYSQIGTHRACPQRWMYANIRRLEKIPNEGDPKIEMKFGSWWHALRAADAIERGRALDSLRWTPKKITTVDYGPEIGTDVTEVIGAVFEAAEAWWHKQPEEFTEAWEAMLGQALVERLHDLFHSWHKQWADEIATEAPMAVELRWRRELPPMRMPDGTMADPNTVLIGYIDEVFFDGKRRVVAVRDHKVSKALSTQSAIDDMMDSQLQFYAWGAAPMVSEMGRGPIQATAYDRARMVAPKPPQLTQSGRLAVREGKPSIGQCDLDTYLKWAQGPDGQGVPFPGLKKDGSGAGFYTAEEGIIETLSSPASRSVWFQRTMTPLNGNIVRTHLQAAVDSAMDMQRTRERSEVTLDAPRILGDRCRWCDFLGLCRAEMIGGPGGEYELEGFGLREKA